MSEMTRLGAAQEWAAIRSQLRDLQATYQLFKRDEPPKQLLDFTHLTHSNLEDQGWIDEAAPRLTVKEIPLCGRCDNGWLRVPDTRHTVRLCPHCEVPRRKAKQLNKLSLPADAIGMSLSKYEWDSPAQQQLILSMLAHLSGSEVKPHCPSAYMWGPPGNGKTSLLYSLARWGCFQGLRVQYTTHTRIMNGIKESFNDSKRREALAGWLDRTDLLLLDELGGLGGKANMTSWYTSTTTEIIGTIYERWAGGKLGVIITSNLNPSELARLFDRNAAVLSRLRSMFGSPLQMVGPDRRITGNERLSEWGL